MNSLSPNTKTANTTGRQTRRKLLVTLAAACVLILVCVAQRCEATDVHAFLSHPLTFAKKPAKAESPKQTIRFDEGEETLTQEGAATLEKLAATLKQEPTATLHLGYAVSAPEASHEAWLADSRAQTVAQFLSARGVEQAQLSGAGFGPNGKVLNTSAVGQDSAENGKCDDGRVEFSLKM